MDSAPLYQKIAEAVRREILAGRLQPGDRLPSVRQMTVRWDCTPGTVQRAYAELASQGLVISRAGQGTHVSGTHSRQPDDTPLRRAALVHRAESFLLEALAGGHAPLEVEQAVREAIERWQAADRKPRASGAQDSMLRFSGSHEPAISMIAEHFGGIAPGFTLEAAYPGSLGGLMALAEGRVSLAGCHLWDTESGQYNLAYVRRIFPGETMLLVTLAHRRLGFIYPAGSAPAPASLDDALLAICLPDVRYANRQPGSGTRVWLDAQLARLKIAPQSIPGYLQVEKRTHTDVARAVASGEANLGLGLEAAARAYGLDFVFLTREVYHLVMPASTAQQPPLAQLIAWLQSGAARSVLGELQGYDVSETGAVTTVTG